MLSFIYHLFVGATWCICKDGSDAVLQKTLDYACGAGADCNPTHQTGPCFNPNTVRAHCSYAVNSYFQKNRQLPTACDFSGTATIVTSDPSEFLLQNPCFFFFLWQFVLPQKLLDLFFKIFNLWLVYNYRCSWLCISCYCKVWTFCTWSGLRLF